MQKKTKVILKNIINLIDFNNVILKNYHLKDCDKHQEFTNIDIFILFLNMMDSKIVCNFLLAHANEDYAKYFHRERESTTWFKDAGENLKGESNLFLLYRF